MTSRAVEVVLLRTEGPDRCRRTEDGVVTGSERGSRGRGESVVVRLRNVYGYNPSGLRETPVYRRKIKKTGDGVIR